MKIRSVTTSIAAPADRVFEFLARPENLPRWAIQFCRAVRRSGDAYLAETADGVMVLAIDSHVETGVVDFWSGPDAQHMSVLPARVLGRPDGSTLVQFLFLQDPHVTDEQFEAAAEGLRREAEELKGLCEAARA